MIANRLGGLSAGAFDEEGELLGFVFGLTGLMDGELVHWSDMLAVRPGLRDRGLGTRLKRYQRDVLLGRGVRRMHWTFDPLQGRNANVNFSKLGIVSREYVENMYGETDSPLHRGVGTDRLVATWELDSDRVVSRLGDGGVSFDAGELEGFTRVLEVRKEGEGFVPGAAVLDLSDPQLLLNIPGEIDVMMADNLPLAVQWRRATRVLFVHYLDRGYEVTEFVRKGGESGYVLTRREGKGAEEGEKAERVGTS
jgi:chorismate synthase